MRIYDALTGEVVGYVRMSNAPYWSTAYEAFDAKGVMYFHLTRITGPTLKGVRHELMAWLLEQPEVKE